jgi:UDPglucose--hexose-1-phosphate uridylyltransferase
MRELRFDPLRDRWVIIVPERARRPSDYLVESARSPVEEPKIVACPFCEGSEDKTPPEITAIRHPGTAPNTPGWRVRVVPNKFPALRVEDSAVRYGVGIFDVASGAGAHEVIIETPDHTKGLADLSVDWIKDVLLQGRERIKDLYRDNRLRYILVFKNHKVEAGASLAHTHSQLIATPMVPPTVKQELKVCRENFVNKERCFICDLINQELAFGERVIYENHDFLVWAPFASSFPFETWVLPKKHLHDFSRMSDGDLAALAPVLKVSLLSIKNLLNDPPYNFVLHTSPPPFRRPGHPDYWSSIEFDYHWHLEIVPRLTRIAGFEWGAGLFINPTPPETAAEYLRREISEKMKTNER